MKNPSIVKTILRNHLVDYYPREESLPAMIGKCVPPDQQHAAFYEQFLE